MKFRYDLAVAVINELLGDSDLINKINGVYLFEANNDATPPYLVYEQITDGTKVYSFDSDEANVSSPQIRIKIWDGDSAASGTTEEVLDLVDGALDFTTIERQGLKFTLLNQNSTTRDYEDEDGLKRSWLQYKMDIA